MSANDTESCVSDVDSKFEFKDENQKQDRLMAWTALAATTSVDSR